MKHFIDRAKQKHGIRDEKDRMKPNPCQGILSIANDINPQQRKQEEYRTEARDNRQVVFKWDEGGYHDQENTFGASCRQTERRRRNLTRMSWRFCTSSGENFLRVHRMHRELPKSSHQGWSLSLVNWQTVIPEASSSSKRAFGRHLHQKEIDKSEDKLSLLVDKP